MGQSTTINVRVDEDIKREVETLFESLGMNISTAVNMFFRQSLMEEAIPFQPKIKHKRKPLDQYLKEYHGKSIDIILKETEDADEKPTEISWGKPDC